MLTTNKDVIIVVDPYSSGALYAEALKSFGLCPVALMSTVEPLENYKSSLKLHEFFDVIVNDGDISKLVDTIKKLNPKCIIAGSEPGVELAETLASIITPSFSNDKHLIEVRRHKGNMHKALVSNNLPTINQICTNDITEVENWLETIKNKDIVIKPPKSAGTDGVTRVKNGDDWKGVFNDLLGKMNKLDIVNEELVVQEYVVGVEYVVDFFSYEGNHVVCDICRYKKIDNGNLMAIYDYMEWVSAEEIDYENIVEYAKQALDAIGMKFGPSHLELMLTEDGPRLIEVGARLHGGGHPNFCRIATGDSPLDKTVRYLAGCYEEVSKDYTLNTNVTIVFLVCKKSGFVKDISVLDDIKKLPSYHFSSMNIQEGQYIEQTKDLFDSFSIGFVALCHKDKGQIESDYISIVNAVDKALN
ncbi:MULTISPECIES: ATP-grasp domain-containing protein [Bacillus]|uniref:ATP-binding protein n=2 Tax=Bacillus cereus group TaxID=86661 RepID=A0A150AY84_BACCE|nr:MULTISPECIES: ATP-grasp domain-containing protein [Bacillus]KAA2403296.1 ATP-grasp domain-containing protein [Bacillus cereus]KLA20738.1 hypothetical protein B4087_4182 [Bacillus cereus]KMP43088.1 ATP-binding protein [Bacillus cereus]KXX89231.1 ATP-binding protein [Bacillus cereus]MCG3789404.1 ATP-grasp domain-containing protein [Bacillus sp. UTDS19-33BHI26]